MKKRCIAVLLCVLIAAAALPSAGYAEILSGYTSKVDYANTDANRYYIEIDLTNQIITVYDLYSSTMVLQSLCTTGNEENPTGAGTYKLGDLKERFGYFVSYGQYAQYWTQVVRGVYIHSVMYDTKSLSSMSKSAYNNLGKNVSHGCVRVLPEVAQWIYYNCPPGTTCKITASIAKNTALVSSIKSSIPSYANYVHPSDSKSDPAQIPAAVKVDKAPLRTGFSTTKDSTVRTLKLNEKVTLLQIGADWCKVRTQSGELGYVKTQYLLFDPDAAVETRQAYTATSTTYLYASATTSGDKLVKLTAGTEVNVTGNSSRSDWYTAEVNGVTGYVRTKYVKLQTSLVYPEVDTTTVITSSGTSVVASALYTRSDAAANLRSAPSSSASVVALLSPSTLVSILAVEGDWYYCSTTDGYTGYLHKSCFG